MSEGKQQDEYDLIGNILSDEGEEGVSPTSDTVEEKKPSLAGLSMDKCSSAPVNNFKARFGTREKGSHSPKKSPPTLKPTGYVNHHSMHYGSYSPEKATYNSNLYPSEFYNQPGGSWQQANPQLVNMNNSKLSLNIFCSWRLRF